MSGYDLYVQRLAANAALLMNSVEGEPDLARDLVEQYGVEPLREGLRSLRGLFARLYADMGAHPEKHAIPPVPDSKVFHTPSRRKARGPFEAPLKALYAFGLAGDLREAGGAHDLVASRSALADTAGVFGVKDVSTALHSLERAGFVVETQGSCDGPICAPARSLGHVPLALKVFCDTCRLWERGKLKARQMPVQFVIADFRILSRVDARARLPRLTVEHALPFAPEHLVSDLRALADHLGSLGYRADVERANALDGECHATFVGQGHGKTIFGFTVCRGTAHLRISFRDIGRMVSEIDTCPAALRREIYGTPCGRCGGNGCGKAIAVTVDGQERLVCYFGIQWIRQWDPAHIEPLKRLLSAQDALYRAA